VLFDKFLAFRSQGFLRGWLGWKSSIGMFGGSLA